MNLDPNPTRADPAEALADRVRAVVRAAAEVLRVDCVGAMLLGADGALRLLGASDDLAQLMEAVQIETGEGPGIETIRTGADVAIADLATDRRWRALADRLLDAGAGAILSSPITTSGLVVGNLNSIVRRVHVWTPAQVRAQRAYARVIGVMLNPSPTGSAHPLRELAHPQPPEPPAPLVEDMYGDRP